MGSSYKIFKIFDIWVELHWTFVMFLIFLLVFLGFNSFIFFVIVFVFVLAHELSHSLIAKASGVKVEKILLTFFGGIVNIDIPENPRLELKMAIAGPAFNFAVVFLGYALINLAGLPFVDYPTVLDSFEFTFANIAYLIVYVNLVLGLFNMLPGFPMDGGRILRSALALRIDYLAATRLAVGVSQYLILPLFFMVGLLTGNIFLMIIPVFLYFAGTSELKFTAIKRAYAGMVVADIARLDFLHTNARITVREFLDTIASPLEQYYILVDDHRKVVGVLNLRKLADAYHNTHIGRLASKNFQTIAADEILSSALKKIFDAGFLLVVDSEKVKGYITAEICIKSTFFHSIRRKK